MSQELLPCPFCGGKAHITTEETADGDWYGLLMCTECSAYIGDNRFSSKAMATEIMVGEWNRRSENERLRQRVKELEEKLGESSCPTSE